jgi:hypothetical protein
MLLYAACIYYVNSLSVVICIAWIASFLKLPDQRLAVVVMKCFAHIRVRLMLRNLNLSLRKDCHDGDPGSGIWIQALELET